MKVLLVTPFRGSIGALDSTELMPSMALLYLASSLRETGHEAVLQDFGTTEALEQEDSLNYCLNLLKEAVVREKPDLVGLSFMFSGMFPIARKYAQAIKEVAPDLPIITGGIHATTFPKEILGNCREFDFICIGEGETLIVELANKLQAGNVDYASINGLAYRDEGGRVQVNEKRSLVNYDEVPMPAWDLVNFDKYAKERNDFFSPKGFKIDNIVPLISSRGCPYKCSFCDLYMIQGRKIRRRGYEAFVDELEYLNKERGQKYFAFQDDNLVRDRKYIMNVCKEIVRRKIDIQFETASGLYINALNDEVIDHLVAAGMTYAAISIEHGDAWMRKHVIKKEIEDETIFKTIESLRRHNVLIRANWIFGFPEETQETLQRTWDMIHEAKVDRSIVLTIIPYPGTPLFAQCVKDDLFVKKIDLDNIWETTFQPHQDEFVIRPYNISLEELEEWRVKFRGLKNKFFGHTLVKNPVQQHAHTVDHSMILGNP